MQLTLIKNPDETKLLEYKIARILYAQTHAQSLRLVEMMASLVANNARVTGRDLYGVISDVNLFDVLRPESPDNKLISVDVINCGFQMCLRVVHRMLNGTLGDMCYGATCFHRSDVIPSWATARGYIADIDGFLFYL